MSILANFHTCSRVGIVSHLRNKQTRLVSQFGNEQKGAVGRKRDEETNKWARWKCCPSGRLQRVLVWQLSNWAIQINAQNDTYFWTIQIGSSMKRERKNSNECTAIRLIVGIHEYLWRWDAIKRDIIAAGQLLAIRQEDRMKLKSTECG